MKVEIFWTVTRGPIEGKKQDRNKSWKEYEPGINIFLFYSLVLTKIIIVFAIAENLKYRL